MHSLFYTHLLFFLVNLSSTTTQILDISVPDVHKLLTADSKIIIIDGRDSISFRDGHLPGAINIDAFQSTCESRLKQLDRKKPLLIYCRTHNRTDTLTNLCQQLGFKIVYRMGDGFLVWQDKEYPVTRTSD